MIASNFGDIVNVLLDQHHKLQQPCAEVQSAGAADKTLLLRNLARLVDVHEYGERAVVYPVTRDHTTGWRPGRQGLPGGWETSQVGHRRTA